MLFEGDSFLLVFHDVTIRLGFLPAAALHRAESRGVFQSFLRREVARVHLQEPLVNFAGHVVPFSRGMRAPASEWFSCRAD